MLSSKICNSKMNLNGRQSFDSNEEDLFSASLYSEEDIDLNLFFHRVDSDDVIYRKQKTCKMIGKYIMGDLLGEGSYGKVKEALDSENLSRRAVKILKKKKLKKIVNGEQNVEREIQLHNGLDNKHIIKLFDVLYDQEKEKMYIIMEYCVVGLQDMLHKAKGNKLPLWQAHGYFEQLLEGLEYLHSRGIIHKDIKPGNLLLALDETLKISDFGVAEALNIFAEDDSVITSQGTLSFQPPEVAIGTEKLSGFKLDIWSCGVTLFNMTTGKYPFDGDNVYRLLGEITLGKYTIPEELEGDICDLILGMMQKDPHKRITLHQAKTHRWVTEKPVRTIEYVPITAFKNDELCDMTVLPYLSELYYGRLTDDNTAGLELMKTGDCDDYNPESEKKLLLSTHEANNNIRREKCKERNKSTWRCINVNKLSGCKQS